MAVNIDVLRALLALNRGDLPPLPAPAPTLPLGPIQQPNTPEYGGPSQVVEPPQAPLDTRLIQQMLALRGPAPTAPAPPSKLGRIFNAIGGFGAGVQGQGAQYLAQLQEPQREYQRQLSAYNNLGTELGTRGLETAQRQQAQKTRRAQEIADQQFQAEFQRETRRLNLSDDREKALLADALLSRRQREDDERQAKLEDQKAKVAKEKQRNDIVSKLMSDQFAPQKFASELADAIVYNKPLSAAAEKWRSLKSQRLEAQLARLNGAGGGGSSKNEVELVDANGNSLGRMPYSQIKFGTYGEVKGFPEGTQVRFPQAKAAPAATPARSLTDQFINPNYVESLLAPTPQSQTATEAQLRQYAKENKISVKVARDDFQKAGIQIQRK